MKHKTTVSYSRTWQGNRTPVWRPGYIAIGSVQPVGKATKDHGTGRVCEADGCETRLTRYNPNPTCYAHDVAA